MGWPKWNSPKEAAKDVDNDKKIRSRAHSIAKSLVVDFKEQKLGTSRNPFINFLMELRRITPRLRYNGAKLAKIGGEIWHQMNPKQKEQFQILEARRGRKRSRKGAKKGHKKRRRRSRRRHH